LAREGTRWKFIDLCIIELWCSVENICSTVVGIGFPVYSTHKAIVRKNPAEQEQWLVYWAGQCLIFFFSSLVGNKGHLVEHAFVSGVCEG
jgi:hypothetical protein